MGFISAIALVLIGVPVLIPSVHAIPIPDCQYGLNDTQGCCPSLYADGCGTRTGCLDPNAQCPMPPRNNTVNPDCPINTLVAASIHAH